MHACSPQRAGPQSASVGKAGKPLTAERANGHLGVTVQKKVLERHDGRDSAASDRGHGLRWMHRGRERGPAQGAGRGSPSIWPRVRPRWKSRRPRIPSRCWRPSSVPATTRRSPDIMAGRRFPGIHAVLYAMFDAQEALDRAVMRQQWPCAWRRASTNRGSRARHRGGEAHRGRAEKRDRVGDRGRGRARALG